MTTIEWINWIAFTLMSIAFWLFLVTAIAEGSAWNAAFVSPLAVFSTLLVGAKLAILMGWLT